jgi:hypothetical protein
MVHKQKALAVAVFLLCVLFFLFFSFSKHTLGGVNPFAEDPYDAVGSFGVQLAMLSGLMALVRAVRPAGQIDGRSSQDSFTLRAAAVAVLAVTVTLLADGIALARYPSVWMVSFAGRILAGLTAGLALMTALTGALLVSECGIRQPHTARQYWRAVFVWLVGTTVLASYPVSWRQGVFGAVFTAALGTALLFLMVWSLATAILPQTSFRYNDVLDDAAAVMEWLRTRVRPAQKLFQWGETLAGLAPVRALTRWLNPRRHRWNIVVAGALAMGACLTAAEVLGEGGFASLRQALMVITVIVGLESAGLVLGYVLLGDFLGLFARPVAGDESGAAAPSASQSTSH